MQEEAGGAALGRERTQHAAFSCDPAGCRQLPLAGRVAAFSLLLGKNNVSECLLQPSLSAVFLWLLKTLNEPEQFSISVLFFFQVNAHNFEAVSLAMTGGVFTYLLT